MRTRTYTLYAMARRVGFTVRTEAYSRGSHRWIYEVRAVSVRQAYALAAREIMAVDERSVGVRRIERDWWHDRATPGPGDRIVAPYVAQPVGETQPWGVVQGGGRGRFFQGVPPVDRSASRISLRPSQTENELGRECP